MTAKTSEMTEKRAGEIALAIVVYRAKRRDVQFSPRDHEHWDRTADKYDLTPSQEKKMYARVIFPQALAESTGGDHCLNIGISDERELAELGAYALKMVRNDGLEIHPKKSPGWLRELAKDIEVPHAELKDFFVGFVIPQVLAKALEWDSCGITGTRHEK